jgi:hypothetical protein
MSVIYTETVRRYFTEHRPLAMEALVTPQETEDFFRYLGAQIEEQVQQSEDQIAGPAPVGETYLEHVGRMRMARSQAQEIALADLLYRLYEEVRLRLLAKLDEDGDPWGGSYQPAVVEMLDKRELEQARNAARVDAVDYLRSQVPF